MIESSSKNDCEQESRNLDPFQDQDGSTTLTMSPSVRSTILCQGCGTSSSVDDARSIRVSTLSHRQGPRR